MGGSQVTGPIILGFEEINLSGSGPNTLVVTPDGVEDATIGVNSLTGLSHSLVVNLGSNDTVVMDGQWTSLGEVKLSNGLYYNEFQSSQSTLFVEVVQVVNHPAVIAGVDTGAVKEDVNVDASGFLNASGLLTVADPDAGQSSFQANTYAGAYGSLTLDAAGNWHYQVLDSLPAVESLAEGQTMTDTIAIKSFDGTLHNIVVTITGTNDAAVIAGVDTGAVKEDVNVDASGFLNASGLLTVADPDAGQNSFQTGTFAGTYGSLVLQANGQWAYSVSNLLPAVQALGAGQVATDTIVIHSLDGTAHNIVVSIDGINHQPVFNAADQLPAQLVVENTALDVVLTAGSFTDPVASDALTYSATYDGAALPAWLSINAATGEITGTAPNVAAMQNHVVTVTATDMGGQQASEIFNLTIQSNFNSYLFDYLTPETHAVRSLDTSVGTIQINDMPDTTLQTLGQHLDFSINASSHYEFTLNQDAFNFGDAQITNLAINASANNAVATPTAITFDVETGTSGVFTTLTALVMNNNNSIYAGDFTAGQVINVSNTTFNYGSHLIYGLGGADTLAGNIVSTGSDTIIQGLGTNNIYNFGSNVIHGGAGDDLISGALLANAGTAGFAGSNSTLNFASNSLYGGAGNDTIIGDTYGSSRGIIGVSSGGNDKVNLSSNTIEGGSGNDTIYGNMNGADLATGTLKMASNTFVYDLSESGGLGNDVIKDFKGIAGSSPLTLHGTSTGEIVIANADALEFRHVFDANGDSAVNVLDLVALTDVVNDGSGNAKVEIFNNAAHTTLIGTIDLQHNFLINSGTSDNIALNTFYGVAFVAGQTHITDYANIHVTIDNNGINTAPVFMAAHAIAAQQVTENTALNVALPVGIFVDTDAGDHLTYSALYDGAALPAWLSIDPLTGAISGTAPLVNADEVHTVTVIATDTGGLQASDTFNLTIKDVFNPLVFDYLTPETHAVRSLDTSVGTIQINDMPDTTLQTLGQHLDFSINASNHYEFTLNQDAFNFGDAQITNLAINASANNAIAIPTAITFDVESGTSGVFTALTALVLNNNNSWFGGDNSNGVVITTSSQNITYQSQLIYGLGGGDDIAGAVFNNGSLAISDLPTTGLSHFNFDSNTIHGGSGNDILAGDILALNAPTSVRSDGGTFIFGSNHIYGGAGDDIISGDTLSFSGGTMGGMFFASPSGGGTGGGTSVGGSGNVGGGTVVFGSNVLEGGAGNDTLWGSGLISGGGSGLAITFNSNTFVYNLAEAGGLGNDIIKDYHGLSGSFVNAAGGTSAIVADKLEFHHVFDTNGDGLINVADLVALTDVVNDGAGQVKIMMYSNASLHDAAHLVGSIDLQGNTVDGIATGVTFVAGNTHITDYANIHVAIV